VAPTGAAWSDIGASLPDASTADERALTVAYADRVLRTILSGREAWVTDTSRWWNCSGKVIGRVIGFRFAAPASFIATLPTVGRPAGRFSYARRINTIRATNWTVMSVWVDTRSNAVVGVAAIGRSLPGEADGTTSLVATIEPWRDMGGPDSGDCWKTHD
jgi:hypothetical protein